MKSSTNEVCKTYHDGISFGEVLKYIVDQIESNGFYEFLKFFLSLNKTLEHWDDPLYFDQTLEFVCGEKVEIPHDEI